MRWLLAIPAALTPLAAQAQVAVPGALDRAFGAVTGGPGAGIVQAAGQNVRPVATRALQPGDAESYRATVGPAAASASTAVPQPPPRLRKNSPGGFPFEITAGTEFTEADS